jgi:predicted GNAT family acetyltransferase
LKTVAIRHEPEARRFVADVGGATAYLSYREPEGRILDLDHTYVPRPLRGRGIASQLAAHALTYARERGCLVVPSCSFVSAYIARHEEFRDLLA